MSIQLIITYMIVGLLALWCLIEEYRRVAMMMQQNSYRIDRFRRWMRTSGDTTSYPHLVGLLVIFAALGSFGIPIWGTLLCGLFSAGAAITLFKKKYKKPLVCTPRVKRIFYIMAIGSIILVAGAALWGGLSSGSASIAVYSGFIAAMALYVISDYIIIAAIWLLSPIERRINQKYYDEAASILASMPRLKVVGITGSYGKTSTKYYLNRILSEHFEVLMTPGSYNTTMGVIRTVRELLKPYCEVFICEMGAKQPGDIKEICDLVHPSVGIVTAVGPQHLESFKTIEAVRRTKFELIDSLPADGLAVVNDDFEFVANRKVDNVTCVRYGVNADSANVKASNIIYGERGTDFEVITADGRTLKFHTRLVGECNVSNLVAAIVVAQKLGVPEEKIRRAVERIEPVEHRLSMKRTPGGVTIIDDAFNSNPTGSSMALDVLAAMPGRRIIITPGMIELGDRQYDLNFSFGEKISRSADIAFVVGEYNRAAIVGGIESNSDSKIQVIEAASFAEAQARFNQIALAGDVVLYENDLPDTFK